MATKAAKSLTINATKFELANKLAIDPQTGKLQLIAKDVVLDEVELPTPETGVLAVLSGDNSAWNNISNIPGLAQYTGSFLSFHDGLALDGETNAITVRQLLNEKLSKGIPVTVALVNTEVNDGDPFGYFVITGHAPGNTDCYCGMVSFYNLGVIPVQMYIDSRLWYFKKYTTLT